MQDFEEIAKLIIILIEFTLILKQCYLSIGDHIEFRYNWQY